MYRHTKLSLLHFVLCVFSLVIASCGTPADSPASPTAIIIPATTPILAATSIPPSATPIPIPARAAYILNTSVDYDLHIVSVDETITYPNHTGQSLEKLVLAIVPNLWPNCFTLTGLSIDNIQVTDYTINLYRLEFTLPAPLQPDSVSTVTLSYKLSLPFLDQAHSLRARIFGYSDIQMNLVNWYPFIVPFMNGEWILNEPWSHGEYLVYDLADFEVNLKFSNLENTPVVAASGYAEPIGEFTRYILTEGRAFALSASRDFEVSTTKVGDVKVYSYYFPIYKQAGLAAMIASAQAIQVYSQRFGPYPHKTLSVVIADFQDSMEFSALYFHSRSFYNLYDGTVQNYLNIVAVHETAHQWWFEQVANDQAYQPWLDESLTTYSEAIYYETLYPELVPWWWSYRIDFFKPSGYINIPVYDGQNNDTYKNIVYFNGAHFLQDIRQRIGDQAFFAFLQDYLAQGKGRIATSDDFFRILNEHTDVDYSDIVRGYFR
jgi:hypothetical protein